MSPHPRLTLTHGGSSAVPVCNVHSQRLERPHMQSSSLKKIWFLFLPRYATCGSSRLFFFYHVCLRRNVLSFLCSVAYHSQAFWKGCTTVGGLYQCYAERLEVQLHFFIIFITYTSFISLSHVTVSGPTILASLRLCQNKQISDVPLSNMTRPSLHWY